MGPAGRSALILLALTLASAGCAAPWESWAPGVPAPGDEAGAPPVGDAPPRDGPSTAAAQPADAPERGEAPERERKAPPEAERLAPAEASLAAATGAPVEFAARCVDPDVVLVKGEWRVTPPGAAEFSLEAESEPFDAVTDGGNFTRAFETPGAWRVVWACTSPVAPPAVVEWQVQVEGAAVAPPPPPQAPAPPPATPPPEAPAPTPPPREPQVPPEPQPQPEPQPTAQPQPQPEPMPEPIIPGLETSLRVRVSPDSAAPCVGERVRVAVDVTDAEGNPVQGAEVSVVWRYKTSMPFEDETAGGDGRVEFSRSLADVRPDLPIVVDALASTPDEEGLGLGTGSFVPRAC